MNIDLFYDYICPFSYVATVTSKKLEEEFGVTFTWKGYELHPEGTPLPEFSPEIQKLAWEKIYPFVYEAGLPIAPPKHRARTRLALGGAEFARQHAKFGDYHRQAFHGVFCGGLNLEDKETVLSIGESIGLARPELAAYLDEGRFNIALDQYRREADDLAIFVTPSFVVNGRVIYGPDPYRDLRYAIQRALGSAPG